MIEKAIVRVNLDFDGLQKDLHPAAYLELGKGPKLLMLHGFMGDATCWQPLMTRLRAHYHCVSLDLMGFGESAKPKIRYDVAKEVSFVRQVVEKLALDPCYILGHSFGGWVASAYALQYPSAVQGLILAAAAGIRDDSFCGRYDHLRPLLWTTPLVDWLLAILKPIAAIAGQQATLSQLHWFRRELMVQPAPRSFLLDRLRPEDAVDTVEKEIHRLRVPTLVITGDRDETIPLWHSQTYAREIPGAQLVTIPEADHALPQHYADELAALILKHIPDDLHAQTIVR
ncbi:MAG: alpha/beta hydrolase [Scytolyngbya sp. HA4215-MV1]|jgi:pimeloyl-ACP methyl ester carboxylesterase|nr:alpha/beta hydrolase [Scytolyngbya sp. HA4215-MV1]